MSGTVDALLAPLTFLPFFQLAAYHLTEELHLWHKHPLVVAFESAVSGKSPIMFRGKRSEVLPSCFGAYTPLRTRIEPASFAGETYISRSSGIAPPATAHRYRLATLQ